MKFGIGPLSRLLISYASIFTGPFLSPACPEFGHQATVAVNDLKAVFGYVDDMDAASKDTADHALHLRKLFVRLREHGLVINAEKCVFGASSIEFLGHCLSVAGVRRF